MKKNFTFSAASRSSEAAEKVYKEDVKHVKVW